MPALTRPPLPCPGTTSTSQTSSSSAHRRSDRPWQPRDNDELGGGDRRRQEEAGHVEAVLPVSDLRQRQATWTGSRGRQEEGASPTVRVESGMDNSSLRSAPNLNFKDMDKCF